MVMGFITMIMPGMVIIVVTTAGFSMLMFVLIIPMAAVIMCFMLVFRMVAMIMFGFNALLFFQRCVLMARMIISMFVV